MTANEALARRFFDDVWSGGKYDALDRLVSPDHQHHISGSTIEGHDGVKDMARSMRVAFPDLVFVIEDTLVDADRVLVRWTARGTHAGTFGGVDGTGRRVEWTGMDLIRIDGGKIVEIWGNNDALGLFEQLE